MQILISCHYYVFELGKDIGAEVNMEKVHRVWTKEMDKYFSQLLINYEKQNKVVKWSLAETDANLTEITFLFNKKCKLQFGNEDLRLRFGYLTKQLNDINNILKQKGFIWDFASHMIIAGEKEWDEYVKVQRS